ncbi:MAG: tetratricopeptide repeat protein [Candidatus Marinimicrobia bacterium]|nr:tetratricopeptide repeat protein [Candidatus Neomarinimicrobiota bacterium]
MDNNKISTFDEQETFEKAIAAKKDQNNKKAMQHLNNILEHNRENAQALNLSGIIYYEEDEFEKARDHFIAAIKNDASLIDAQHNYAETLIKLKDYENGVKAFVKILENHPDNVHAILRLAQLSAEAGHLENAKDFCDHVLELDPENSDAKELIDLLPKLKTARNAELQQNKEEQTELYQKAEHAINEGDHNQAFIHINEILAKDPNNPDAYNLAGQIFLANGKLENAKKSFLAAINCNSKFKEAKLNLAKTYIELEEYSHSKNVYEKIIDNDPKNPRVLEKLAELNSILGNDEDAAEYAEAVLEYAPQNKKAQQILANQ